MKKNEFLSNLIPYAKRILFSVLFFILCFTNSFCQYDTLKLVNYLPDFYVYSATGVNWTTIDEIYTFYDNGWHEPGGWGAFTGGWDGRGKSIFAQPASTSATVAELSFSNIHSISTSIGLYEGAESSVNFVIQLFDGSTYHTMLDEIVSDVNPPVFYNIDLSAWNDQEITLRFITDPNGFDYYDWSYWGEPKVVIGPIEKDIKIEEIVSPDQQFILNDIDEIKVKISNNGINNIDTVILNYKLSDNNLNILNSDTFVINLNSLQDTILSFRDSVELSLFEDDFFLKVYVDSSNDNNNNLNDTLINNYSSDNFIVSKVIDSIIIDGRHDAAWSNFLYEDISNILGDIPYNDLDFSAKFKSAWDITGIYFIIKVTDDILYSDNEDDWLNDAVELFFDINNSKSDVYEDKDFQIRLIWNIDEIISGDVNSLCDGGASSIEFAQIDTLNGYFFEVKFPWEVLCFNAPSNNQLMGFDTHVSDNDGGDRDTKLLWNDTLDIAWNNTSVFGTIRFLDEQITCKSDTTVVLDTICNGENINIGDSLFTETGNYVVNLLNQNGCDSVVTLDLTVNENPIVSLGNDSTISATDSLILDAGNGHDSYLWNNGETTQTIIVDSLDGFGENTYSVLVSRSNCYGSDTIIITIERPSNVNFISDRNGFIKLYPNPTNGLINIELENIQDKTEILIYSETGQIIFSKQYSSFNRSLTEQLDLSEYQSGTYIIKVINNDKIITENFVLKK